MNKLNRDIRLFLLIKGFDLTHFEDGLRQNELIYFGHKINYTEYVSKYDDEKNPAVTVIIDGANDADRRPCFSLSINDKLAILEPIKRRKSKWVDRFDTSKYTIKAAFQLAKEKGCTEFEIIDSFYTSRYNTKYNLSDIYFLTHGRTWLESILPVIIKSSDESIVSIIRQRALSGTWQTILTYLLESGIIVDFDLAGIDFTAPGSAMEALKRIKDLNNDLSFKFFAKNGCHIIHANTVHSLNYTRWIVQIS